MKVGVYNEPYGGSVGGSESVAAILAEALSDQHQVEIVHHRRGLCAAQLAELSGADLSAVRLRYAAPQPYSFGDSHNPWKRYREARAWHASLSDPYELFIALLHGCPPFCHAGRGVLLVLFPFHEAEHIAGGGRARAGAPFWGRVKSGYHRWEWARRLDSYQKVASISDFAREWTKRRWGVDSEIVYVPVDISFRPAVKSDMIFSVGRFTGSGHSKKQLEMVQTFRWLEDHGLRGWGYTCAGGLGQSAADRAYFESVRRAAGESGARVLANVPRADLRGLYGQARVFWHAAGWGEDEGESPELAEHFGISTVEAMAAGCVPLVVNRGGQREIVEHGVSGLLWDTPRELAEYTLLLARDDGARARMSEAARARARAFSREEFLRRFLKLLGPLSSR